MSDQNRDESDLGTDGTVFLKLFRWPSDATLKNCCSSCFPFRDFRAGGLWWTMAGPAPLLGRLLGRYGGFQLVMGVPYIMQGVFVRENPIKKVDDHWGYPYDLGHLHMIS